MIQALRLITSLKLSDWEEYFTIKLPKYDGQNIGRIINQGGRKEGLKQMCLVSDQETGHTSFQTGPVNQEFEKHCNVKYAQRGSRFVYCTSITVFPAGRFVLYTLLPFFPLVCPGS